MWMRPQNKNTTRNLAICFLKINCEMQTGRAKKREGWGRRHQLDTLSLLLFAPMPLFVGPKRISAHRNAFNAGYPERGSVPITEKMTAGMKQG